MNKEKQFKVLSGGFDEDGNPLYLIKDTDIGFEYVGDFEICKKVIEQQSIINKLKEENEQLKEEIKPLKQKEEVLNKIWRGYLENHKEVEK